MKDNQLSIKKHIETYHSLWCFLIQDSAQVLESLVVSFGTEKQMQTSPLDISRTGNKNGSNRRNRSNQETSKRYLGTRIRKIFLGVKY